MTTDLTNEDNNCRHHWIIEEPNDRTSKGTCKLCGATRRFNNSLPGIDWWRNPVNARTLPTETLQRLLEAKKARREEEKLDSLFIDPGGANTW